MMYNSAAYLHDVHCTTVQLICMMYNSAANLHDVCTTVQLIYMMYIYTLVTVREGYLPDDTVNLVVQN